jgi:ParB family chromosome partitioning protein
MVKKVSLSDLMSGDVDLSNDAKSSLNEIDVDLISDNPRQPRKELTKSEFDDLVNSVKTHGVMQPIVVREIETGYELIAGQRRLAASRGAKKKTIPAVIRNVDDKTALALSLIENIQRVDLSPMDEAHSIDMLKKEFKLSNEECAKILGKNKKAVTDILNLINLPKELQEVYDSGKAISPQTLSELRKSFASHKDQTILFINNNESITYSQAVAFYKSLKEQSRFIESGEQNETQNQEDGLGDNISEVSGETAGGDAREPSGEEEQKTEREKLDQQEKKEQVPPNKVVKDSAKWLKENNTGGALDHPEYDRISRIAKASIKLEKDDAELANLIAVAVIQGLEL